MLKIRLAVAAALLFTAACARRPAPTAPAGAVPTPAWGQPTKDSGCVANGSLQDTACTPGDIVAANTKEVICSHDFHTGSVRDTVTTPAEKRQVYDMYGIPRPRRNSGRNQVCEIDHLVSLELGGNDTMANLWPECSPGYAGWSGAGFRDKDKFENYLHRQVCSGKMDLAEAQRQIATDWYGSWVKAGKPGK